MTFIDLLRPIQFRGKARLLNPFVPKRGDRVANVFGAKMRLDLSEHIQRYIYMGAYEREETVAVKHYLRAGWTVVDVGANVGYFTALAASGVGSAGRVIAIEPSAVAFARLSSMIAENRLTQCAALNVGLADRSGECALYRDPQSTNHTPTMVRHGTSEFASAPVKIRLLDDVLDEQRVGMVDLLKIDVEGYEPQVLAGAARALAERRVRAMLIEFNDYWLRENNSSAAALRAKIDELGFVSPHDDSPIGSDVVTRLFVLNQKSGR